MRGRGEDGSLESALERVETQADAALESVASVAREVKRARSAAASGQTRDLRRALQAVRQLADELAEATALLEKSFDFDEQQHMSSGAYARELMALAAESGVAILEQDERLLCYPSLVRVLPSDVSVEIDRKRDRKIRPSVVVSHLRAANDRPPRFRPEPFLETLFAAYELERSRRKKPRGTTVPLALVYGILTLLPGQNREYTKPEFVRDLYLLDESGVDRTRNGAKLSLPASTMTKGGGGLTTVTKDGRRKVYAGVSFS